MGTDWVTFILGSQRLPVDLVTFIKSESHEQFSLKRGSGPSFGV